MADALLDAIPESLRDRAEEVRAHLVALRGGAPFLSPADARLLVAWLQADVPVSGILAALERAADVRQKTRARVPFTLGRARPYLKSGLAAPIAPASGSSLHQIASELRARGEVELADRLLELDGDVDVTLRAAASLARGLFLRIWEGLPERERDARVRAAMDDLEGLGLDEKTTMALADEQARDAIRADWPMLSVERLWAAVHGAA